LADICALFDEHEIDYSLQMQPATTNGTGIIPLASTQLNMVDTLVYIQGEQKPTADQLVEAYEQKAQAQAVQAPEEDNFNRLYWVAAFFLAYVLWKAYVKAQESGML
jgi:hypothetical protein